jgi:hypothetical protein
MFAGAPPATSVQRAPVPGRFSDHIEGYSTLAGEIGLKNNGE